MIKETEIKIDFDLIKKSFILSASIFQESADIPYSVNKYVEARKNHRFKPHETSFQVGEKGAVMLVQQLPFQWGFQPGFREKIAGFLQLAKHCRRILVELALEEKHQAALNIIHTSSARSKF